MAKKRLEIPRVGINGVSEDYVNEICGLVATIEVYKEMKLDWFYKVNKIQRYEERFPHKNMQTLLIIETRGLSKR